jgi:hypothetical protein
MMIFLCMSVVSTDTLLDHIHKHLGQPIGHFLGGAFDHYAAHGLRA